MVKSTNGYSPLTQLCSQLETSTGILLSLERLNPRFNSASVASFRTVLTTLLQAILSKISHTLSTYFGRILILDIKTVFMSISYKCDLTD